MKKFLIVCLVALMVLSLTMVGCEKKPDPNKYIVKIEVTGDKEQGTKIYGKIKPDVPSTAGFSSKPIELVIPGSVEVECGPANYEVSFMAWSKKKMNCKVYVDGVEWTPPKVLVAASEGSYSAMFELPEKNKGAEAKKK